MAAILQSANILANNAAQYQNANARIFDAITNAANAYEEGQRRKAAMLEAERKRQADAAAAQQAIALDPEKVTMQVLTKAQQDPASVTPQERAMFDAAQKTLGAKMAADQYGRAYRPYSPISLSGAPADVMAPMPQTPMAQEQELPAASPMGSMMDMPLMPNVSGGLLPPPVALKEGETRMDMTAPAPIGQAETKVSAISQVQPVKMVAGAGGPVPDPIDLERHKAEMAVAMEKDKQGATTEAEARKTEFGKGKLQSIIEQMQKVNEQLKAAGGLKSEKTGAGGRIIDTLRNTSIPIPFSQNDLEVGKTVEGVIDPKVAKLKQEYERLRALGFQFYKNASGLSASQMNTEKEQQLALSVFGDTGGFYESNKSALENLAREYGTGKGADSGLDKNDPRVQQALKAGYTEEQVKAFLNGRK